MSITRAYLVGPPLSDLSQTVAGLPVFLRTLLSLQEAGVREVFLSGVSLESVPSDPRLTLVCKEAGQESLEPSLVARLGVLWHPALPQRLAKQPVLPEEINGFSCQEAALYAAGEEALPQLLRTIADPEKEPAGETPKAPEFVITPASAQEKARAEELFFASLIKPSDGLVSRKINRPISMQVTRLVLGTSLTPNQMTLIAALLGMIGVALAWRGGFWGLVLGALFYQTQSVLDGCDGEIARLKHLKSRFGEWLDQVLDDVINISFLVAVGRSLSLKTPIFWKITLIVLAAHTLYQISLYAAFWWKAKGRASVGALRWWGQGDEQAPAAQETEEKSAWQTIKFVFENAGKRDFFTLAYLPCALLGVIEIAFFWHAFIAALSGVITTAQWVVAGGPKANP